MNDTDKRELEILKKIADAKMWHLFQFTPSVELYEETIESYNKIINILKKYTNKNEETITL